MNNQLLNPNQLSERWQIASTTLRHWRWSGKGPKYLKLGGRVMYRIKDIEEFEEQQVRTDTTQDLKYANLSYS